MSTYEYEVEKLRALRNMLRALEEGPPGLGRLKDQIVEEIREAESALRRDRIMSLEAIAADLQTAVTRLAEMTRDGQLDDMDLQGLGTLFGHWDRVWDRVDEEWKVA